MPIFDEDSAGINIIQSILESNSVKEAESIISLSSDLSFYYAANVLRDDFPNGEESISRKSYYSLWYARDVMEKPFPKGEKVISKDCMSAAAYIRAFPERIDYVFNGNK